jgi:aryl-alcohol dehydrogenase-like predicted oxidoreductase
MSNVILERVEHIAKQRSWPMSHVALAWLNKRVVAPVVGFSSIGRMEDLLAAKDKALTAEEEQYLEELYVPQHVQGHS